MRRHLNFPDDAEDAEESCNYWDAPFASVDALADHRASHNYGSSDSYPDRKA
jgi:hypothetical protein